LGGRFIIDYTVDYQYLKNLFSKWRGVEERLSESPIKNTKHYHLTQIQRDFGSKIVKMQVKQQLLFIFVLKILYLYEKEWKQ
jgi:hypothetical protein